MMNMISPELVEAMILERSKDAESARIVGEAARAKPRTRLRPRLALVLGGLAARIHPEAARLAVGSGPPGTNGAGRHGRALCMCEE
jgi:hypothetical protein